ncbi:MAG: hypothetical protein ACK4UN_11125 [Limisphaerales bacterium]
MKIEDGAINVFEMKIQIIFSVGVALIAANFAEAEEKKEAVKAYPLKTCIVTDEPLDGSHGATYVFVHGGQEIKMCCKGCTKKFNKEQAKYLKKLEKPAGEKSK